MNTLCWNCRGVGNPRTIHQLKRWSHSLAPDIIFLSETMIKKKEAEDIKIRLGFKHAFAMASVGKAGGLCMYWREDVSISLVSYSQNHICGDVGTGDAKWRFVGVYGWPKEEDKHKTWSLLRYLCDILLSRF